MRNITENNKKKVLVVPLSWGLGHATRLIPVIRTLLDAGAEVVMGGGPEQRHILKKEFPELAVIPFPFLRIQLSKGHQQIFRLALQVPRFLLQIIREHQFLKNVLRDLSPDAVISDNCYGLWNRNVPCFFITHQLWIRLPGSIRYLEQLVNRMNHWFIRHYTCCWIPDLPENNGLAGILSHTEHSLPKVKYVGILSRFIQSAQPHQGQSGNDIKLLIILSGPEKQRTLFENRIRDLLKDLPADFSYRVVRGLPSSTKTTETNWYNYADTSTLARFIREADLVISRAGYSTVMDLITMNKPAILVPTPGQTEQLSLAEHLQKKGIFPYVLQDDLQLENLLRTKSEIRPPGAFPESSVKLLNEAVQELLSDLDKKG